MQSADELVIGVREASLILGVDGATVSRWAQSGKLPSVRKMPGKRGAWLFDPRVVRRLAQEELLRRAG